MSLFHLGLRLVFSKQRPRVMAEHEVNASLADVYPKFTPGPDLAPGSSGIAPKDVTDTTLSQGSSQSLSKGQKVPHHEGTHGTNYSLGEG